MSQACLFCDTGWLTLLKWQIVGIPDHRPVCQHHADLLISKAGAQELASHE